MQIVAGRRAAKYVGSGSALISIRNEELTVRVPQISREAAAAVIDGLLAPGENTEGLRATIACAKAVTIILTTATAPTPGV